MSKLIFDSKLEPVDPSMVLLSWLRQGLQDGRINIDVSNTVNPIISYDIEFANQIDDYVHREQARGQVDILDSLDRNKQMFGDWQQVIADEIQKIQETWNV